MSFADEKYQLVVRVGFELDIHKYNNTSLQKESICFQFNNSP